MTSCDGDKKEWEGGLRRCVEFRLTWLADVRGTRVRGNVPKRDSEIVNTVVKENMVVRVSVHRSQILSDQGDRERKKETERERERNRERERGTQREKKR